MLSNRKNWVAAGLYMGLSVSMLSSNALAADIHDDFEKLLQEHNLVESVREEISALQEQVNVENSGYYPKFTI